MSSEAQRKVHDSQNLFSLRSFLNSKQLVFWHQLNLFLFFAFFNFNLN